MKLQTKSTMLICILVLACGMFGCANKPQDITFTTKSDQAKEFFVQGLEEFDNIAFDKARQLFAKAIEADPEFAIAYYYWANTATTTADYLYRFNKAVELAPKASEGERLIIMAEKAVNDNKPDEQKKYVHNLVALFPQGKRAHYQLANYYSVQQDYQNAESEYKAAIAIDPTFAAIYNLLGYLYSQQERNEEAISSLKKYAEFRPKDPNPRDSEGEIYLRMDDFANSEKEYRAALDLNPDFVSSIAGLGHIFSFNGEYEKARAKYEEMLSHAHSNADTIAVFAWKATTYIHEGNPNKALQQFDEQMNFAIAHSDIFQEANARAQLAEFYRETGKYDLALAEAAKEKQLAQNSQMTSAARDAYNLDVLFTEAFVFASKGMADSAESKLEDYRKIAAVTNSLDRIQNCHLLAGTIDYLAKNYADAITELTQSNPQNPVTMYYLGLAYEGAGQSDRAKQTFTKLANFNRNGLSYSLVRNKAKTKA